MAVDLSNYVEVSERITNFYAEYPTGSLRCKEIREVTVGGSDYIIYVAQAYRTADDEAPAEGAAWEPVPGKSPFTQDAELMNAETSAWGRAIAALGFDVKRDVASANEVRNRDAGTEIAKARDKTAKALDKAKVPHAFQRDLVFAIAGNPPTVDGLQRVVEIVQGDGPEALFAAAGMDAPEVYAARQEIQAAYDAKKMEGASTNGLAPGKFKTLLANAETPAQLAELAEKVEDLK